MNLFVKCRIPLPLSFVICSYIVVCLLIIGTHGNDMCGKKCICHKKILECKRLTQQDLLSDTFQNTIHTNYKTIRLIDGNITELPKNLFGKCANDSSYRLDNLLNLDLHSNSIKVIHGQSLHCIRNLTRLNLSNNQWNVSTIHTRVFTSLPKLKYLILSNAFHDQIQGPVHLAHLNTVFLENDLTKLEVLLLDNNRFSFFGKDSAEAICTLSAALISLPHGCVILKSFDSNIFTSWLCNLESHLTLNIFTSWLCNLKSFDSNIFTSWLCILEVI
jgi:hypothetical protein